MPNFYRTILYIYHAIGKSPHYHKWALICRLIYLLSMVSEPDFISNIIVVFNSVSIFADILFIYLWMLSLTY